MKKKFFRSTDDRLFAGVCGGIARHFELEPMVIRIVVGVMLITGFAAPLIVIGYVVSIGQFDCISDEEYRKRLAE